MRSKCEFCDGSGVSFIDPGIFRLIQRGDHGHALINGRDISTEISPSITVSTRRDLNEQHKVTVHFLVEDLDIDLDSESTEIVEGTK